jgi:hypothetical protein
VNVGRMITVKTAMTKYVEAYTNLRITDENLKTARTTAVQAGVTDEELDRMKDTLDRAAEAS